jgi:hypothetical protein
MLECFGLFPSFRCAAEDGFLLRRQRLWTRGAPLRIPFAAVSERFRLLFLTGSRTAFALPRAALPVPVRAAVDRRRSFWALSSMTSGRSLGVFRPGPAPSGLVGMQTGVCTPVNSAKAVTGAFGFFPLHGFSVAGGVGFCRVDFFVMAELAGEGIGCPPSREQVLMHGEKEWLPELVTPVLGCPVSGC